ncbi:MAG TPA: hypothetical protein VHL79_06020, partial [Ramlibacter sp.]|nr:hypothetical protein [Ramlibacter sp.]
MMRFRLAALAAAMAACTFAGAALAQAPRGPQAAAAPTDSGMDAALFYQLLLGELNARGEEPGAGFALILDAARKTSDPALYQRAVEVAFQSRSGDAALQAARAWKQAFPQSREANRFVLQILVALNRLPESIEPLRTELALADAKDRSSAIAALARTYSRATDKKVAASTFEQGVATYLSDAEAGASAWS